MKSIFTATLLFIAHVMCFAQIDTLKQQQLTPPAADKWSLKECVDYALANSLTIQRSNYNVETSEVDLRQAKFSRLPSINGSVGYGYSWGRGLDPTTNNFVSQEIKSSSIAGNASLPIYNGMRIHNTIKQNQRSVAAS